MKWKKRIPVEFSQNGTRLVISLHGQTVLSAFPADPELQPGSAGQLHFSPKEKPFIGFIVFDAPEVDDVVLAEG